MSVEITIIGLIALAVLAASAAWSVFRAAKTDLPWRKWRVWLLVGLRIVVLVAVAGWCLGLRVDNPVGSKSLDLVVIADRSVSVSSQGKQAVDQWVAQCRDGMKGRGLVEVIDATSSDKKGTPLAEAVEAALRKFSPGSEKRLLVVSDGRATTGDMAASAGELARRGVRTFVAPVEGLNGEALVADIRVAPSLWRSVPAAVEATLQTAVAQPCKVTLLADGQQADQKQLQLPAGQTVVELKYTPAKKGVHRLEVKAEFTQDSFEWDNSAVAIVDVPLAPRVRIIAEAPGAAAGVVAALQEAQMDVTAYTPADMPADLAADCIVLSNVPAEALGPQRLAAIEKFVREGGAIVFAGGPRSYAAGGYVGSAIENVFPVLLMPRKEYPPYALAVVLDNSWSMNEGYSSNVGKIDLAKEIAIAGVEGLNKGDWLMCVSFDSDYHEIIPPTKVDDLEPAKYQIARIGAFGMTNILGGLQEASKELQGVDAAYRHIVLISDGQETETGTDYSKVLAQLEQDKVTLTTIGIGLSPNEKLLNTLAFAGKGRYYHAKSLKEVPSIVLQEAKGTEDPLVVAAQLPLKKVDDDAAFAGIDMATLPPVYGYNRTRGRSHAWTPVVIGRKNDPLLARMRYGRGQALAFTSAASSTWVKDWIQKAPADYATFWRQAVASVLPRPYRAMEPGVRYVDGAPVFDFGGREVSVRRADGAPELAPAQKTTGEVPASGSQAVLVSAGEATINAYAWSRTYGREFADADKGLEDMKSFCAAAGGKFSPTAEEVLAPPQEAHRSTLGPDGWLILAAALLVAELLVRRLPVLKGLVGRRKRAESK